MKYKVIDAAKKSALVMLLASCVVAFFTVTALAFELGSGWLFWLWIPLIGVVAFIWSLNPFKWFS